MSVFAPYGKIPGSWPTGITQSRNAGWGITPGAYSVPYDPYFNQRGEAGFFHDTALGAHDRLNSWQKKQIENYYKKLHAQSIADEVSSPFLGLGSPVLGFLGRWKKRRQLRALGAIPTDFEMSANMNYTPVTSGWVATREGYKTPPWLPPNGWAQGGFPPPIQPWDNGGERSASPMLLQYFTPDRASDPQWNTTTLGRLHDVAPSSPAAPQPPASVEDVMYAMNAHNDRVFALALVSTTAVTVSAILGIFRTLRLIRVGD